MKRSAPLLVALAVLLGVACDGDGDGDAGSPPPTATVVPGSPAAAATPTLPGPGPSPTPPGCPIVASACAQAMELARWLAAGDVQPVVRATQAGSITCPGGRPSGAGGPFPLCDGAAAGEVRTGVGVARRYSEGAAISTEAYEAALRGFLQAVDAAATDGGGSGALRLVAVSCVDPAEEPQHCTRSAAIFSAIVRQVGLGGVWGIPGGRELLVFYMDTAAAGTATPIRETWTGIVQPPEVPVIFQAGGVLFDLGRVFVLR